MSPKNIKKIEEFHFVNIAIPIYTPLISPVDPNSHPGKTFQGLHIGPPEGRVQRAQLTHTPPNPLLGGGTSPDITLPRKKRAGARHALTSTAPERPARCLQLEGGLAPHAGALGLRSEGPARPWWVAGGLPHGQERRPYVHPRGWAKSPPRRPPPASAAAAPSTRGRPPRRGRGWARAGGAPQLPVRRRQGAVPGGRLSPTRPDGSGWRGRSDGRGEGWGPHVSKHWKKKT